MVKQTHSKAKGKLPVTRHPLFPVTVALWFGALFGLGCLAVRASLLESAIVALKIDAIITSAVPPIGITTRILLALAMAALGGLLGAAIARRIGQPKKVVQQRKRGAGSVSENRAATLAASFANRADPEAPSIAPASGRRSQLAMKEEAPTRSAPHETAPVPGGAPQILDVSAFELEGFEAPASEKQEFIASEEFADENGHTVEPAALSELDSSDPGSFDSREFEDEPPEGAQIFEQQNSSADLPAGLEEPALNAPAPFDAQEGSTEPLESNPQQFQPEKPEPQEIFGTAAPIDLDAEPFTASEPPADPAPFANAAPEGNADSEPETPDLPRFESEEDQQQTPSVFDPNPAPSLFAQPLNTPVSQIRWSDNMIGRLAEADDLAASAPTEATNLPEPDAMDSESAAQRIASEELDRLSPLELLERLAISIRRKRSSAPEEAAPDNPPFAQPSQPAIPEAFVAPEPQTDVGMEEDAALDDQPQTNDTAPAEPFPVTEVEFAPPPPSIPAALRPVGLDPDDDEELLPHYVPPRRIGMERGETAERPEPMSALNTIEDVGDRNAALDDGYSSLLNLSQPAPAGQRFVRVEEPEQFGREAEPVVIFPGQETGTPAPFAPPTETKGTDERDVVMDTGWPEAPDETRSATPAEPEQQDQPAPFAPPANRPDPEETERALRSALTTLQRMSGAA